MIPCSPLTRDSDNALEAGEHHNMQRSAGTMAKDAEQHTARYDCSASERSSVSMILLSAPLLLAAASGAAASAAAALHCKLLLKYI